MRQAFNLLLLTLLLAACGSPQNQKTLEVIYQVGGKPTAAVEMYLNYYNDPTGEWISLKVATNARGTATFRLPALEDGSSPPFVFGPSLDFVDWAAQSVESGEGRALRFPADAALTRVQVQIDEGLNLRVLEGSLEEVGK